MTFSLNAVDDPNLPSLPYQARERVPIHLPWGRKVIALGTGFDCDAKPGGAIRPSALALGQSKGQCALEAWTGSNSFRESTSAQAATSYEHMDFKGSMSMGGSVLGAEGRGAFANDVYRNQDMNKTSIQASLRIGMVTPVISPALSRPSLALLKSSPSDFHRSHGDYFVAGFCVGADTSSFLSSSSSIDVKSEMKSIQIKAKFLGMSKTVYDDHTNTHSDKSAYNLTFSGLDTLDGFEQTTKAFDQSSYAGLKAVATQNVVNGIKLRSRVADAMKEAGVSLGETLTLSQCDKLFNSGLVVEIMLLPYSRLRDYVVGTSVESVAALERSL